MPDHCIEPKTSFRGHNETIAIHCVPCCANANYHMPSECVSTRLINFQYPVHQISSGFVNWWKAVAR